jgi:hypothetical protein
MLREHSINALGSSRRGVVHWRVLTSPPGRSRRSRPTTPAYVVVWSGRGPLPGHQVLVTDAASGRGPWSHSGSFAAIKAAPIAPLNEGGWSPRKPPAAPASAGFWRRRDS